VAVATVPADGASIALVAVRPERLVAVRSERREFAAPDGTLAPTDPTV